jgi:hypothetical protein
MNIMSYYNNETLLEQQQQITKLTAERDALRKDAERYRWLRTRNDLVFNLSKTTQWCGGCYPEAMDAAIDEAIKGE